MQDIPYIHPDRRRINMRPLRVAHHFRNLVADKEDTEQVFHIINNLRDGRYVKQALKFIKSPQGEALYARQECLADVLDDHDSLLALPVGSLGRTYAEFMERENLSAHGLIRENDKFFSKIPRYNDRVNWYNERLRDTHDLVHIVTGYGRDPLGEECILAFSYSQTMSLGSLFIAYVGGLELKRKAPSQTPVFTAIREARRNGKLAKNIGYLDIIALLPLPLTEVRAKLGIKEPVHYNAAHDIYKEAGVNPHDMMALA